ncbi:MAG: sigma-54 dependent transcriptional regulator [Chitinispirillia bacterium]|jgi:DNA-binding NtrC family response regulator
MEVKSIILIASSDPATIKNITGYFSDEYEFITTEKRDKCLTHIKNNHLIFIFLDIDIITANDTFQSGFADILECIGKTDTFPEIIVLCPPQKVRQAVQFVRIGASGYLIYPIDFTEVGCLIESIREYNKLQLKIESIQDTFWLKEVDHLVKTKNASMQKVINAAKSVAQTNSTVLITGETGTGKGVLGKLIHQHSLRKEGPFISIHCGAIPENLIESELFGHEKGSYTGALSKKMGRFELSSGGTIFLDEVGTMTLNSQIKLLRILQERIIQRVGSENDIPVDVRVIAAANRNLLKLCENGEFRTDLYYRLNVFPIEIPPLRSRKEDIPHIADVIINRLNASYGKNILGFSNSVINGFQQYSWPGNIRELENVIERAYILENSSYLTQENFPIEIVPFQADKPVTLLETDDTLATVRQRGIKDIEIKYIQEKLAKHSGRIDKTANEAGISPRQLHKLMTKYQLKREQYLKQSTS